MALKGIEGTLTLMGKTSCTGFLRKATSVALRSVHKIQCCKTRTWFQLLLPWEEEREDRNRKAMQAGMSRENGADCCPGSRGDAASCPAWVAPATPHSQAALLWQQPCAGYLSWVLEQATFKAEHCCLGCQGRHPLNQISHSVKYMWHILHKNPEKLVIWSALKANGCRAQWFVMGGMSTEGDVAGCALWQYQRCLAGRKWVRSPAASRLWAQRVTAAHGALVWHVQPPLKSCVNCVSVHNLFWWCWHDGL